MARETAWKNVVVSCILLGMLAPRVVEAGEVDLGARTSVGYDSNVFSRRNSLAVDSAVIQLEADAEAKDELESGTYRIRYSPNYIINTASQAKNLLNNRALAEGTYVFSPRTKVTLSDNFAALEKIVYRPEDTTPTGNIDDSNKRTITNALVLSGSHLVDPLTTLWGNSVYSINRYSRSNDTNNDYISGQAGVSHAFTPRLNLGGGGMVSYRSFDASSRETSCSNNGAGTGPGSRTLSYSAFLSGSYRLDPTTNLRLQAGPAQLQTVSYVCDTMTNLRYIRRQESQITWYAEGTVAKGWEHVNTLVSYTRSEGLGGAGTSTINDDLLWRLNWQPARLWEVALRAGWIHRAQQGVKQFTGTRSSTDTTTWTVAGRLSRLVLQRLRISLNASYRNQNQNIKGSLDPNQEDNFDAYRILVGVEYQYDPIRY